MPTRTESKTARLTLLVDPRKKALFEEICAAQDITPSQVVRQLIREYVIANAGDRELPAARAHSRWTFEFNRLRVTDVRSIVLDDSELSGNLRGELGFAVRSASGEAEIFASRVEIADLLLKKMRDPRIKGATLTGIRLSDDLKYGKVYYSVLGDKEEIRRVQAGFDRARGFIKREIGIRMDLKYVPDIQFVHDPSLAKGERMERLFEAIKSGAGQEGTE